ncbi:hypothetical protein [Larkinella soli]|uniref:hypothetical protein n=1 Tax=Larkinella soli TaxID=1770527 RepID=UPI000FFBD321|nr:hypothetical protein [Larkinella soli]
MKFYEKYPLLRERAYLTRMLTDTVFSTMALENQEVARAKVERIVAEVMKEKTSKGGHFIVD